MKKIVCLTGLILLLISLAIQPVFAGIEDPDILLNGIGLDLKGSIREGQLFLPVRAISEGLGYDVGWSQPNRSAAIDTVDRLIQLDLETTKVKAGDHEYYMLYSPAMIHDRIYMREDFFSDNLAIKVQWDQENNQVLVSSVEENQISIQTVRIDSETETLSIAIQYPKIEGLADEKVQSEVNALFKDLADKAARQGMENAEELAPYTSQYPERPIQCTVYFDYQIKYNQNGRLSIVFQNYQYAGGAHGSTVQTGYTTDLATGQRYGLADMFKDHAEYIPVISDRVKEQLEERDLAEALFQPFSQIRENQPYYLNGSGVVVFFQQYEILPYAAGIQEFTVDYTMMADLLKAPERLKENPDEDRMDTTRLLAMWTAAQQGKTIHCIYPVNTSVIETVTEAWGVPDDTEYQYEADGVQVSFPEHQTAFRYNKGSQIFEVQSFDQSLQNITPDKAVAILGTPVFRGVSEGHKIMGYNVGDDYNLILFFSNGVEGSDRTVMESYEVLYPRGTINLMADDPGRDWPVLHEGDVFSIQLKGNPTTGYSWYETIGNDAAVQLLSESVEPESNLIGAPSTFRWDFRAAQTGDSTITFKYYRGWEGENSALPEHLKAWNISVQ